VFPVWLKVTKGYVKFDSETKWYVKFYSETKKYIRELYGLSTPTVSYKMFLYSHEMIHWLQPHFHTASTLHLIYY
jgi:hypothetical protein